MIISYLERIIIYFILFYLLIKSFRNNTNEASIELSKEHMTDSKQDINYDKEAIANVSSFANDLHINKKIPKLTTGNTTTDTLSFKNTFKFIPTDTWLQLKNNEGNAYYGGIATKNLYANNVIWIGGTSINENDLKKLKNLNTQSQTNTNLNKYVKKGDWMNIENHYGKDGQACLHAPHSSNNYKIERDRCSNWTSNEKKRYEFKIYDARSR